MQLYLSGSLVKGDAEIIERILRLDGYRLCTYAYPKEAGIYLDIADALGIRAHMMMDSGAFSSWNSGKPVELEKLIAFNMGVLEKYGDRHDFVFISLDVMPGQRGRRPTEAELKAGMKESYENFIEMQNIIPRPVLPVYHSGEPTALRDYYLQKTDHICLSMNQRMGEKYRVEWATRVQVPGVKMHGLAATGNQMIRYVDWYSVDSAAWIMLAAMGQIYWPTPDGLITMHISNQSSKRKQYNGHATSVPMSAEVEEEIERRGFKLEALENDHRTRMAWNLEAWSHNEWKRTPVHQQGLFHD